MLMRPFARFPLMGCLAAVLACLATAGPASAAYSVQIQVGSFSQVDVTSSLQSSGENTFSVNGNGDFLLFNRDGMLTGTAASVGNAYLGVKVSLTDNAPGGSVAQLFTSTNEVRSNGNGGPINVVITAAENAFTSPTGLVTLAGSFSSNGGGGNTQPTSTFTSSVFQGTTTLASVNGTGTSSPFSVSGTYGVRNVTTVLGVNSNNNNTTTGQSTVQGAGALPAPAPAGLLLAAFGIPAFGLLRRFGRKNAEVAVAA